MTKKRYRIQTTCPQCGCSGATALSEDEMQDRYGDVPNVEMSCHECMIQYHTPMEEACPEWDEECKLKS
jgi:hypothetical protein